MSNSAAYGWSYVDVEAERRRELRAQLSQEVARSRNLRGQARSLRRAYRTARIDAHAVTVPAGADSAGLAAALEAARRENDRVEAELSRVAAEVWSVPPSRDIDRHADTGVGRTGRPVVRPSPNSATRAVEERAARVRAAAVVEAEALLRREGPACEPGDLPAFARRLEALRRARSAEETRTLLHDLGVLVHKSTQRRRDAVRLAGVRAALLERLEDAAPLDREHLAAAVADAPDPSHLAREVDLAVARADTERARDTVADALMQALRTRDYAVGDDFADLLAEDGSVVVPFDGTGAPDGYGLRIALAADRAGLTTTLVRAAPPGGHEAAGNEAGTDQDVQRWFCDEQLPKLEEAVREQGVDLARTMVLPPGLRPTVTVPEGLWPDRARSPSTGQDDTTAEGRSTDGQSTDGPASPARKRKKKPVPRSTFYGQERQRGR
ncbi:hypothetical protein ABZ588_30905 [Streptomyces althioticus]|uniref:hypothetical protein n=1 Tax=Streptomyces althioticus TaxID=83380 RepID=UPI0033ECE425